MGKMTYAKALTVWNITSSDKTKQIATTPREIVKLKLISTGGSAHVSIYDSKNGSASASKRIWVLDSSTYTNDSDDFIYPLSQSEGLYAVCDDGFTFNPQLCISYLSDQP